jgi:hypothetical protein
MQKEQEGYEEYKPMGSTKKQKKKIEKWMNECQTIGINRKK